MGRIDNKILKRFKEIPKKIKDFVYTFKKIFRDGGYTKVNISFINYGEVLNGKKILITGGSSGIGLSIANKCLDEGATVLITGRNIDKLEKTLLKADNDRLKILVWDISKTDQIQEKVLESEKLLGGEIDILVNNAGIINGKNFPDVTEEIWDKIYSVNSRGLFFLTQYVSKQWLNNKERLQKKIINISSQGGFVGATYPYRMTKWDVAGLTQGLGIKLAPFGIIVNGIAPGIIATEMQPKLINQGENLYSPLNPIQRFALPEEISELAIFLMNDSSNFIVGQTIVCDGGFTLK